MLCSYGYLMKINNYEDMNIYRKINEYVGCAVVVPFDKDILNYLNSHVYSRNKEIETNYLASLNSSYSIDKCPRFSRYLALAMEGRTFKLCEGRLGAFDNEKDSYTWIEDDNYVYDVTFMGVWPKNIYYKLFLPSIDKIINLDADPDYQEYKKNTVETNNKNRKPFLKYHDWYSYYYFYNPFIPRFSNEVKSFYFPCNKDEALTYEFVDSISDYWYNKCKETRKIPTELLKNALVEFITQQHYLKPTRDLYYEYISFISTNYGLYEENKNARGDLTLWKTAVNQKFSGSLCRFIGDLPKALEFVYSEKEKACK